MRPTIVTTVTDSVADTEYIGKNWCPGCFPEWDPTHEILNVIWCDGHRPGTEGAADGQVMALNYMSGSAEAGGSENAAWCAQIHRGLVVPITASSTVGEGAPVGDICCG